MDDRVPLKKKHQLRWAGNMLAGISDTNRPTASRFLDWKVHQDRRRTASFTNYAQIAKTLDEVLQGRPYHTMTHLDGEAYIALRSRPGYTAYGTSLVWEFKRCCGTR